MNTPGEARAPASGMLHLLYSPRAEGCPRLALELIEQEKRQKGRSPRVAFCVAEPTEMVPEFRAKAVDIDYLDWKRRAYFGFFLRFLRLLRRTRPRGIVCYTVGLHVPAALAARITGIPLVLHLGNMPPADQGALRKISIQMMAARPLVRAYAACSQAVADASIAQYGIPRREVFVVPNGIDLGRFLALRGAPRRDAPSRRVEVGMVASLEAHKNHALLLRAFRVLLDRDPNYRLTLVGGGALHEPLHRQAEALGVDDSVCWAGVTGDVAGALAGLDAFAFCTTDSEGMGIAVVEALAAGLPVVASDVSGVSEVMEGGRWGILVRSPQPEPWATALASYKQARIPPPEALARFDIAETFRAYARLLSGEPH